VSSGAATSYRPASPPRRVVRAVVDFAAAPRIIGAAIGKMQAKDEETVRCRP
jgi:hypothetical protein